jgi:hypothetical protein
MARQIDWTKQLSEEDKAYALQRDMHDQVAENEAKFGKGKMPEGAKRDERIEELRSQITELENELGILQAAKAEEEGLGGPAVRGSEPVTRGTFTDGDASQTGQDVVQDYTGNEWTSAKLKDEIKARNEDRKRDGLQPLSTSGSVAELRERLIEDDREIAAAEQADAN